MLYLIIDEESRGSSRVMRKKYEDVEAFLAAGGQGDYFVGAICAMLADDGFLMFDEEEENYSKTEMFSLPFGGVADDGIVFGMGEQPVHAMGAFQEALLGTGDLVVDEW